jgi:reactive intermediate/imine deaminase
MPGGHYSLATVHNGLVFTAGHLPVADGGHELARAGFEDQVRQTFRNLFDTLAATGAGPQDVLRVTVFIVGMDHWARFNALFAEIFGDHRPARTVVPVPELHYGYLVEIEAIAAQPRARDSEVATVAPLVS